MKKLTNSYLGGGIKNKGFTLIELLAVIVVLAVISLIATPIVLSILTKVRKSAFQDSAYGIMEAVKSYFAEMVLDENNLEEKVFSFEKGATNELSYSGTKPKGGMLVLSKTGEIELAIHNSEWCAIKSKTESNVKLIKYEKDKCKVSGEVELPLISVKDTKEETIKKGLDKSILEYFNIASGTATCIDTSNENVEVTNTSSLDLGTHNIKCTVTENEKTGTANKTIVVESLGIVLTEEKMIAEVGENGSIRKDDLGNPRYAGSNPNNWVCFGTQNEICDAEHLYRIIGIIDGKIKIIRNGFYNSSLRWDKAGGTYGSNNWNTSDLKKELNGTSFYGNKNYMDEMSKNYIEKARWYIGGLETVGNFSLSNFEKNERKKISNGYIGLMSVIDVGYASNNNGCKKSTQLNTGDCPCMMDNYLFNIYINQWTITPLSLYTDKVFAFIGKGKGVSFWDASSTLSVRPSLFLKPEVEIISGKGTKIEPYCLSM